MHTHRVTFCTDRCIVDNSGVPPLLQAMGEESKKMYAMSATLRRLCCPKPSSGKLEVSQEVYKQWKLGGDQRKALLKVLINADGNRDRLGFVHCCVHVWDILHKILKVSVTTSVFPEGVVQKTDRTHTEEIPSQ